jgi:O-antigen ligase
MDSMQTVPISLCTPAQTSPAKSLANLSGGAASRWLLVLILCYLFSGQALDVRDPLGHSLGWHIYAQLILFGFSLVAAMILWRKSGRALKQSPPLVGFAIFGAMVVISSVRSFWPPLSLVKGVMFCLVLLLAEMLCATFDSVRILRSIYHGTIVVFGIALVMGLLLPDQYPLILSPELERQRLALFSYQHGDFAYMTGMGVFLGRLPQVRGRWYCQLFLLVLTIASGSRSCAVAVCAVWAAAKLYEIESTNLRVAASCAFAAIAVLAVFGVESGAFAGIGGEVYERLAGFYGSGALEQSPAELSGRLELWTAAAGIFQQCVLVGFGFDGARDQLVRLEAWAGGPHNGVFELLLAGGLPATMAFLAGWLSAIRSSFKWKDGRSQLALHAFLLAVAGTGPSFTAFQALAVLLFICMSALVRPTAN